MDKEKIMMAMEHIDVELIAEAAGSAKPARKYNWRKVAVTAACLCLALAGTVVAVAKSGVFVEFHGNDIEWMKKLDESLVGGYWVSGSEIIQEEELSEDVRALAAEHPDLRFYGFETWEEMETLVGFDVANNALLDGAEKRELKISYLAEPVKGHGILDIQQDDLGIRALELAAHYEYRVEGAKTEFPITVAALIRTDLGQEDDHFFFGTCYTQEQQESMTVEEYVMANGQTATIVSVPRWDNEGEFMGNFYDAYFNGHKSMLAVQIEEFNFMRRGSVDQAQLDQEAFATLKHVLDAFE